MKLVDKLINTRIMGVNLVVYLVMVLILVFPLAIGNSPSYLSMLVRIGIFSFLAVAYNITNGYLGMFALNHVAFFGIGAYTSTFLQVLYGVNPWIGMVIGGLLSFAVASGFVYPAVRLKGLFMTFATLAFLVTIQIFFLNWSITITNPADPNSLIYMGGAAGAFVPLQPDSLINFQWHLNKLPYVYLVFAFLLAEIFFVNKLLNSRLGYYFRAIRDDDVAAEHVGINTVFYKILAVGISAFLCAFAGTFYAQYVLFVEPVSTISIDLMFLIVLSTMIGGMGTLLGPIIGNIIYVPMSTFLTTVIGTTRYSSLSLVILGVLLLAICLPMPEGILGALRKYYKKRALRLSAHEVAQNK